MASPGATAKNGVGASPLHPPQASGLLPTASDYQQPPPPPPPPREKTSGSFYDPLTDTTRERRPSDSWSGKQVR